jgi:hypothetical protein
VGVVVPSAFHANEGATGVRQLYLGKLNLHHCYSFENRRKLFEIDSRFKFATVVAQAGKPTERFSCAFYLHDDEWLFAPDSSRLSYSADFVKRTTGEYLSFLEPRSSFDVEVIEVCFANGLLFGDASERRAIHFGRECDMALDSWRFTPLTKIESDGDDPRDPDILAVLLHKGYEVLHEGKTFRQYDDHWADSPAYLVAISELLDKPDWLLASRYYRLAHRRIAGPGDENVSIWVLLPPGVICGHNAPTEKAPGKRLLSDALSLLAIANAYGFDWQLAQRVRATVNAFIRDGVPVPQGMTSAPFLSHSALRLTCNHAGYGPLWKEQVCDAWREPGKKPLTWPVLAEDDERWAVRAAIDAVVADAYCLSRTQYAHVLSTFSHARYKKAPELCLARFDELKQIGLEAFMKKHDPYWDIPLNENLPKPVIDLPIPDDPQVALFANQEEAKPKKRTRKKTQG